MKKLTFDSGIEEFRIQGGGVLRFNPADPNLYGRFLEAADKLKEMESELVAKAKELEGTDTGSAVIALMGEADRKMKQLLGWVFGGDNDFDKALGGVNLLAVASNGERLVTNLFAALEGVLTGGAERFAAGQADSIKTRRQAQ